jgi:hypothetical protein
MAKIESSASACDILYNSTTDRGGELLGRLDGRGRRDKITKKNETAVLYRAPRPPWRPLSFILAAYYPPCRRGLIRPRYPRGPRNRSRYPRVG